MDRVQVIKQESTALGGDDADASDAFNVPIAAQEDALEAAGLYLQDGDNRDENVLVWRDGNDIKFKDVTNPSGYTLAALSAGGSGISAAAHRALRQLIHFIDGGPAEGFASGAHRVITGTAFPSAIVWWEDNTLAKKIVEKLITYTGIFPTTIQWKVYDTDGTTVLATVTDAISYSGPFETTRTRTIA